MRAISLWQPWASAIALELKKVETRHWSTPYRGPLVIHASKRWDRDQRDFAADNHLRDLPFGALICVVGLVDVRKSEEMIAYVSDLEKRYGNFGPNRYGWCLSAPTVFAKPIPFKGHQGFFDVPDELLPAMNEEKRNGN